MPDLQLDPARINVAAADFPGRYGFRRKPDCVRFRCAHPGAAYTELTVCADELTAPPGGVTRACILDTPGKGFGCFARRRAALRLSIDNTR